MNLLQPTQNQQCKLLTANYNSSTQQNVHREYYTMAGGYEFCFQVVKKYCFQHDEIMFISSSYPV